MTRNNSNQLVPKTATHPGEFLLDEIEARGIKQNDLAIELDLPKSAVNEIIKGKKSINPDIALRLENILDIPATFWLNAQMNYDIDKQRISERNRAHSRNAEIWKIIKSYISVPFFKKQGIITNDLKTNINNIFKVFNARSLEDFISCFSGFELQKYRKSEKSNVEKNNLISWVYLVKYIAKNDIVLEFNHKNQEEVFNAVKGIIFRNSPKILEELKNTLKSFGIKFLVVENPKNCAVDGVSFWSEGKPTIALSLRNKTTDSFAFTLFHELSHIYLHLINDGKKDYINVEEKHLKEEQEADFLASESLIPFEIWQNIKKCNFHNENEVQQLSIRYQIHPSVLQGRYSKETGIYKIKKIDGKLNLNI